ncbi:MAG: molybdopterin molybdotransferase MoeA [Caulobacteraceae bacterium]
MNALKDLTVEEARARMLAAVAPGAPEAVALDRHAIGRVLAEPVLAARDQPPFDASAMDGYAARLGDGADSFEVVGESAAGRPFVGHVGAGQTVRIFTGAEVPPGCAVIVQERARREGSHVRFDGVVPSEPTNVRPRAGDFAAGDTLLAAGVRLDAWRLGLAAAAGRAAAEVYPQPRVAILSTGEEIVPAGTPGTLSSQIFDSNGPSLAALVSRWGGQPIGLAPVGDDEDGIVAAVEAAPAELIVAVGGASVGDYDLVKPALRRLGLELVVESISLRPGKPTWFGKLADGRRVLGLPGNPASALAAAELFLRPLLAAWQGADATLRLERARLARPLPETGPREHWMRACLESGDDGSLRAVPFTDQDSSLVSVFASADALLRRPAGAPAAGVGDVVEVLRLDRL